MSDLTALIEKRENSALELRDVERLINLLIIDNRRLDPTPPKNEIGATHWAITPSGNVLYYIVGDEVLIWFPHSMVWSNPGLVPYTLHPFDS